MFYPTHTDSDFVKCGLVCYPHNNHNEECDREQDSAATQRYATSFATIIGLICNVEKIENRRKQQQEKIEHRWA